MAKGRKGSSKAGRPRKSGQRYDCGKLKPEEPFRVDWLTRAASDYNPLGMAADLGIVRSHLHRAGEGFARIYARTGYTGSRVGNTGLHEVEALIEWKGALSTLPDAVLVEAFDRVFSVFGTEEENRIEARKQWKSIAKRLTPTERSELISICIVGDTPFWLLHMAMGKELPAKWRARWSAFISGLRKVCAWFIEQRNPPQIIQLPVQRRRLVGPRAIERTEYVSEAGEHILTVERKISRKAG